MQRLPVCKVLGRSVALWVDGGFFTVGMMAACLAVVEWRRQRHFEQQAVQVQATVLSKSLEKAMRDGNPRTKYQVTYRFAPSGGAAIEKSCLSWSVASVFELTKRKRVLGSHTV